MSTKNPFEGLDPNQLMDQTRAFWENWQRQMSELAGAAGGRQFTGGNPFGAYGANPFAANPFGNAPFGGGSFAAADPFGFGSAFAPRNPMQDAMQQFNSQSAQWMANMQELATQFMDQAPSAEQIRNKWEEMLGLAETDGFNQLFNVMQNAGQQDFSSWLAQVQPMLDWFRMQSGAGDVPAFGLMREHQERWQQTGRWIQEYQDSAGKFAQLLGEVNHDAMNRFESLLEDRRVQGKVIDSTRALFDLWVDAAESAYEKTALSEDYRTAYGEMVNAQMRVRLAVQDEVERMTAAIGIPGRSEIDAAYRKLTQLDREVRNLRDAVMMAATGQAQPAAAPVQRAAAKRAPAKKAASKRAPAKKTAARKTVSKKAPAKRAAAKKVAAKKSASKRAPAKKAARKTTARKGR